tara:strand:- start:5386 stop:5694 length:309 start_codon:yes stop_codon:yes gene_type:complete
LEVQENKNMKEITEQHLHLLTSYIASMVVDSSLSNLRTDNLFVRNFKKKSNNYTDFLELEVYKTFKLTHELDEDMSEKLFNNLKKRVDLIAESFIKYMCSIE